MPRPVGEQVIVITGASTGIGWETAIELGTRGSSVVLAARNETALREAAKEVERLGGKPYVVVTDVSQWEQVNRLAQQAVDRFGRVDTWVNNAAVSEYGTVEAMTIPEFERVLQVILLGQIYGMQAALPHLICQGQGTIINVASVLAVRSVPLQSAYCAAKHGIKGFTETLRMELVHEHPGIRVTLVMPSSINTPPFAHARSKLGVFPKPISPIYEPRTVAQAILQVAEHPQRDIFVGGFGQLLGILEAFVPSLLDWYMVRNGKLFKGQKTNQPDDGKDNLFQPMDGIGSTTGQFGKHAKSMSLYTRYIDLHPNRERALAGTIVLGMLTLIRRVGR